MSGKTELIFLGLKCYICAFVQPDKQLFVHYLHRKYWEVFHLFFFQRNERAVDRAQSPEIKEVLMSAITMFEELSLLEKNSPVSEVSKVCMYL